MPPPVDLSGKRFGDLTVIRKVGFDPNVSKLNAIWLCHCERCGRDEEMIQLWIPYNASQASRRSARYSCTICFRGPCEICGGEILDDTYRGVCSEACNTERRRKQNREFHHRQAAEDPDYYRRMAREKRAVIEADPAKLEAFRAAQRERGRARLANDSEAINASSRKRYWARRDEILAQRKARLAALSEEERLIKEQQDREYRKEWWAKNGERVIAKRAEKRKKLTPDELEARRANNRKHHRMRQQRIALGSLLSSGTELINMVNADESTDE